MMTIQAVSVGKTVTSGSTSAEAALPQPSDGTNPRYCYLVSDGQVHVKLGTTSSVAATSNDLMIGTQPVILQTRGYGFIAYIEGSTAAKLNITPLEE